MSKRAAHGTTARANPAKPGDCAAVPAKAGYHHRNLRHTLIESGKQLLETQGLPAFSLRMAARTAGVSQTAPYHHFADKDGLLAAMAADGFARLATEMEAAAPSGVRAVMTAFTRFARANPQMFRLMFSSDPASRPAGAELKSAFDRCCAACADAIRHEMGEPDASAPRVRQATLAVWSSMYGLSRLLIDAIGPTAAGDGDDASAAVVDIVQRGINAARPEVSAAI
jgi:AcrR family transcriptional regulator